MAGERRAALYCRVSTDEQADRGTSLSDQQTRCERYAAEAGWAVTERFIDDGFSGATTDRPALRRLLSSAADGVFDVVVVTDPDRLSRDLVDGLVIERDLASAGVEIVYLVQPAMSTLERQLRGVIAEEERRKIRDRTSRGLRARAAAGLWPGGPPPYGYRITRSDRGAHLEIDPHEAAVLTAIIDAFVDGRLSSHEIAGSLTARGVPTPAAGRGTANRGSPRWTHRRVRALLASATHIAGTWSYGTPPAMITVAIPPIIDEARLEQLQARLEQTAGERIVRKHFFLLARRITSPCGAVMYGFARRDGTGRVYRCSMSTPDHGPDRCNCPRVYAEIIESQTWNTIVAELIDPDRLLHLAGLAAAATSNEQTDDDVGTIDKRIRRIEKALATRIADLLAAGRDATVINLATAQLETELHTLRRHRARVVEWAVRRADHAAQIERITKLAQSARTVLLSPTNELMAQVIALLDTRVRVVGTTTCPTCHGKGLLPRGQHAEGMHRHQTGDICPTCHRSKSLPIIDITGLLPLVEDLTDTRAENTIPFRLRSIN